jgi:hypothetical protein
VSETIKQKGVEVGGTYETVTMMREDYDALQAEKASKDNAYTERNRLVAFLSSLYFSHRVRHPDSDTNWENDWRWIVCIHTPKGQMTWHIHDSHLPMFEHLEVGEDHWDGHSMEDKYLRLEALSKTTAENREGANG